MSQTPQTQTVQPNVFSPKKPARLGKRQAQVLSIIADNNGAERWKLVEIIRAETGLTKHYIYITLRKLELKGLIKMDEQDHIFVA